MVCVFATHEGSDKKYLFSVPDHFCHRAIKKGDYLVVDTIYGEKPAIAASGFFESSDMETIKIVASKCGGYFPLREVKCVISPEMVDYFARKQWLAIAEKLAKQLSGEVDELPY